jgi:hypothetical protein
MLYIISLGSDKHKMQTLLQFEHEFMALEALGMAQKKCKI